jgi:hypothetical protein
MYHGSSVVLWPQKAQMNCSVIARSASHHDQVHGHGSRDPCSRTVADLADECRASPDGGHHGFWPLCRNDLLRIKGAPSARLPRGVDEQHVKQLGFESS